MDRILCQSFLLSPSPISIIFDYLFILLELFDRLAFWISHIVVSQGIGRSDESVSNFRIFFWSKNLFSVILGHVMNFPYICLMKLENTLSVILFLIELTNFWNDFEFAEVFLFFFGKNC